MIAPVARSLLVALLLGAAADAGAQPSRPGGGAMMMRPSANPSAIVAAEIAFAKLAKEKGQWTAFRETADKDGVMFVPGPVNAQLWLKKRADPAQSVSWWPTHIYAACDGSYAASIGNARWPDGSKTAFVTLWRRQSDGSYKWMLDWGAGKAATDEGPDEVEGKIADCAPRGARGPGTGPAAGGEPPRRDRKPPSRKDLERAIVRIAVPPPADGQGESPDGSLRWAWTSGPSGARTLSVSMRKGEGFVPLIEDKVTEKAAPAS